MVELRCRSRWVGGRGGKMSLSPSPLPCFKLVAYTSPSVTNRWRREMTDYYYFQKISIILNNKLSQRKECSHMNVYPFDTT